MGQDGGVTTVGAVFLPQFPPERLRPVAEAADEAGLSQLWLWEDCFRESGIAAAAATLAWTDRLAVGVGLLPVPLRNVAITAMELATLNRLFPGRAIVGPGWAGRPGSLGAQSLVKQPGRNLKPSVAKKGSMRLASHTRSIT